MTQQGEGTVIKKDFGERTRKSQMRKRTARMPHGQARGKTASAGEGISGKPGSSCFTKMSSVPQRRTISVTKHLSAWWPLAAGKPVLSRVVLGSCLQPEQF